jgi:hypothetical protein
MQYFMASERLPLGHRLISSQPDAQGGELNACQESVIALAVSRGNSTEVIDFIEETLNQILISILVLLQWGAF